MKIIFAILLLSFSLASYAGHDHHNHKTQHDSHASDQNIVIHKPAIKATPPGITNSAGYFKIMNHSDKDIQLLDASSDISAITEVHEHVKNNGVMKMQKVDAITIPAKSSLSFEPGGYHIMFINVHQPIVEDQVVKFILKFSDGTQKTITAKAKKEIASSHGHKHKHH